jgi:hypothetical protein
MKSLVSMLALGFLLIGSHVSAAPQVPEETPPSDLEAPASIESNAAESNASASASASAEFDSEASFYGPPNMRKMTRKYQKYIRSTLRKRGRDHKCTLDKLSVRKEW